MISEDSVIKEIMTSNDDLTGQQNILPDEENSLLYKEDISVPTDEPESVIKQEGSLDEQNAPKADDKLSKKDAVFLEPTMPISMNFPSKMKDAGIQPKTSTCNDNGTSQMEKPGRTVTQMVVEKPMALNYKEPLWSGIPASDYKFEIVRSGVTIGNLPLNKPYTVIGRSDRCDIKMEHPSISRYHCIIQYKAESNDEAHPVGMYLYDLESSHGTFQNKYRVKPNCYSKLNVGHIIKFGSSTRMFILQGPSDDQEEESPYTVTELKKMAEEKREKLKQLEELQNKQRKEKENEGVSWGMGEDAVEEDEDEDMLENPFASNEELSLDDPKKTLRGWFEREGYDLPEYNIEEITHGNFRCKLQIPGLTGKSGSPIVCMVEHQGKKKDTVLQCALEACRMIDKQGLLRQATHEGLSKKRKKDLSENDFYDSDEDEFLDRTGDIERKRRKRQSEFKVGSNVETFDSLKTKYDDILEEMGNLELKINKAHVAKETKKAESEAEDIDEYMTQLGTQLPDRHKLVQWKLELNKLEKDECKVRRLLNVARPRNVQEYNPRKSQISESSIVKGSKIKPIAVGKTSSGVHRVFLEDDDAPKLKLSKLDDGTDDVKAVPYTKPQKTANKYDELVKLKEKMLKKSLDMAPPPDARFSKAAADSVETDRIASHTKLDAPQVPDENKGEEASGLSKIPTSECIKGPMPMEKSDLNDKDDFVFLKPTALLKPRKAAAKPKQKTMFEKECETWQPPVGQSGDGRTSLNEKYGY